MSKVIDSEGNIKVTGLGSVISQVITDGVTDKAPSENAVFDALANKVPYTGATTNVDLGTHKLTTKDLVVNHPSGSGVAASITKGGSGEALTVVKSSGSGNAASITGGVTLIDELHLTTDLADTYIASASTWNAKQAALVSGTNIKTVNGNSLLGSGDLVISGGGGAIAVGTTAVTSGTVGRVFFQGTGDVVQQSSSLFWDNTNSRLGVGATPSSSVRLDVRAQGALSTDIAFRVRNSANNLNMFQVNGNNSIYMLGDGDAGSIRLMRQTGHSSVLQHRSVSTLPSIFTIGTTPSGGSIGQIVFDTQLGDGSFSTFTMQRFISGITDLTGSALQGSFGANNTTCFVMKNSLNYQSFGSIPTTTPIDHFAMYSADIAAGNAAPHFRTENGNIIKLYRETTGIAAAAFVSNTSLIVNDSATYGGYTMGQVVAALKAQGLLA